MHLPDLTRLAICGAEIPVRVTPRGGWNAVEQGPNGLGVRVTAPPAGGKANHALRRLLAKAMGVAPTRLVLVRGATSRDKVFRLA